jgi:DNA-binding IscR family transcriptional regulator
MTNAEPNLNDVLQALAALSLKGHRSSSLDDIAAELGMPAPYTEPLQRLLQGAERDELVRAVEHENIGDPYYALTEDDERRGDA